MRSAILFVPHRWLTLFDIAKQALGLGAPGAGRSRGQGDVPIEQAVKLVLAALIPLLAGLVQWIFWDFINPYVWFLFYPAVFFSSWVGGRNGGLLATGISVVVVWYVFIPPQYSFILHQPMAAAAMVMFAGMGALFSVFHGRWHLANQRATAALAAVKTANDELEQRIAARTADLEHAVAALRLNERHLRELVDSLGPHMFVGLLTPSGIVLDANRPALAIAELRLEDVVGLPLEMTHWWSYDPAVQRDLRSAIDRAAAGIPSRYDVRVRTTGGTLIWIDFSLHPALGEAAKVEFVVASANVITERKIAEAALRESRSTLFSALESMTDAVVIADAAGRFLECNEAFATFHKFPTKVDCVRALAELPACLEVFHATGEKVATEQWPVSRAVRGETGRNAEYRLRRLDTGEDWIGSFSFAPIRGQAGAISGAVCVGRDITEQKRAELTLRENEARLRLSVQSANIGLWDWDLSANTVYFSPEWKRQLGYEDHEISNLFAEWQSRVHPEDLESSLAKVSAYLKDPRGRHEVQMRMRHKDGTYRWIHALADVLRDAAGRPVRMLGCHLDVTERIRDEQERQENEQRLRLASDAAQIGIWESDLKTGRLIWSEQQARIMGFAPGEFSGQIEDFVALIHPEDREPARRARQEAIAGDGVYRIVLRFCLRDGRTRWGMLRGQLWRDRAGGPERLVGVDVDITEQKHAEQALRESELRFATTFHSSPTALITSRRADGRIMDANAAFLELVKLERAEVMGRNLEERKLISPETRKTLRREFEATGRLAQCETVIQTAQGERRDVLIATASIRLGGDDCALTTMVDITARKQAESELREMQALYRSLVDQMPAGVFRKDAAGRYVFVNDTYCQMTGASAERYLGRRIQDVMAELTSDDDVTRSAWSIGAAAGSHHAKIMATGQPLSVEEDWLQPDGTRRHLLAVKTPVFSAQREIIGTQGVVIDITELKRTSAALQESEGRLQALIDLLPDAMFVNQDNRVAYVNQRARQLWRAERAEQILGVEPARLFHPDYHGVLRERVARLLHEGGYAPRWETQIVTCDGGVVAVESVGCAITYRGRPAIQVVVRDITERRQAEAAVQQLNQNLERRVVERTAELAAANRELEAFSYSVSHDLRAPLRAIDGFSQAVVEDFGPQLPPDGRRQLEVIRESAQHMGHLIDDLLTFSRLSRQTLHRQAVDMTPLVRAVLGTLRAEFTDRSVEVQVAELPACAGDPALLKQVWVNLLANALKYTRRRAAAVIQVSATLSADGPIYSVRDNGCGFDMRYADKLFGVFHRLHRAEDYEGTGVGLAIVHRIVGRHGGRVWAEAAVDQGATFSFTIGQGEVS